MILAPLLRALIDAERSCALARNAACTGELDIALDLSSRAVLRLQEAVEAARRAYERLGD